MAGKTVVLSRDPLARSFFDEMRRNSQLIFHIPIWTCLFLFSFAAKSNCLWAAQEGELEGGSVSLTDVGGVLSIENLRRREATLLLLTEGIAT